MPIVLGGLILSFFVMMLFGGSELDRTLRALFEMVDFPGLRTGAEWLSAAATPLASFLAAMVGSLVLAVRMHWQHATLLLGIVATGHFLIDAVQVLAQPLRIAVYDQGPATAPVQALFPSGQASGATIAALALAFLLTHRFPVRAWALAAAAIFAFFVGLAGLVLGAWPTEVIGGWALGLAWTLLLLLLARADVGDGVTKIDPGGPRARPSGPWDRSDA